MSTDTDTKAPRAPKVKSIDDRLAEARQMLLALTTRDDGKWEAGRGMTIDQAQQFFRRSGSTIMRRIQLLAYTDNGERNTYMLRERELHEVATFYPMPDTVKQQVEQAAKRRVAKGWLHRVALEWERYQWYGQKADEGGRAGVIAATQAYYDNWQQAQPKQVDLGVPTTEGTAVLPGVDKPDVAATAAKLADSMAAVQKAVADLADVVELLALELIEGAD